MPNRPQKKVRLGERPSWNDEPDYYFREHQRLQLVEAIKQDAGNFHHLPYTCPGCDCRIWEARKNDVTWRGCHCLTLLLPPGHRLYEFNMELWARTVKANDQILAEQSQPTKACVRTLTRIHPSLRDNPFSVVRGTLGGMPHALGFNCAECQKPVRRGYTQAELTGYEFSVICCACAALSQLARLGDPSATDWPHIVAEARELAPGAVKIHSQNIEQYPDLGGLS
jgi:hypothetical protein